MDGLKVEIITRNFSRMLEELANIDPTIEFKDVVDGVATRVAQGAMNRTRAAKASSIKQRHEGKEWTTFDGKKVRIGGNDAWRFPDAEWASIQQKRNELLQLRLAARGTAKQNWLGFANQLGRSLKAPAYVLGANYRGKTHEGDSTARVSGNGREYTVTLLMTSPLIPGAGMERALVSAMAGETRYFYINMENRAFRTFASRAAKYPGIFIRQGAAA
jgi:hypothetical protein